MHPAPDTPPPPRIITAKVSSPRDRDLSIIHASAAWAEILMETPERLCELCRTILQDWYTTEALAAEFRAAGRLLPEDVSTARANLLKLLRTGGIHAQFSRHTPAPDQP